MGTGRCGRRGGVSRTGIRGIYNQTLAQLAGHAETRRNRGIVLGDAVSVLDKISHFVQVTRLQAPEDIIPLPPGTVGVRSDALPIHPDADTARFSSKVHGIRGAGGQWQGWCRAMSPHIVLLTNEAEGQAPWRVAGATALLPHAAP